MSLKIRIKQPLPAKRRIRKIEFDDDNDDAAFGSEPRSKKPRTDLSSRPRIADPRDDDEDVNIDGDIEDTRFLPDPQLPVSRSLSPTPSGIKLRLPNPAASSSKSRPKEKQSNAAKSSKSVVKKSRRQVIYTDSEDENFDDPDVVATDDDDFEPEPEYTSSKKGAKGKSGKAAAGKPSTKGKVKTEDKDSTFRGERRAPAAQTDSAKRVKPEDDVKSAVAAPDPLDEPIPKRRKLPPIKKNRPAGVASTGSSTPAASKSVATTQGENKETLTPTPTSNQVGVRKPVGGSTDLNLLDSSVYSSLFKSAPGGVTPNSGLNRKQKEEVRKKELDRMRREARAKREAEGKHSFNLQSAPENIQRFEDVLRSRHSMARYPNIVGAAFKEMAERRRAAMHSVAVSVEQSV